jgi:DnaK suppressor protein
MPLSKSEISKLKSLLHEKRLQIIESAKETLSQEMALDTDDLPDEMDLAASEYLQSLTLRLRGRDKFHLEKVEHALEKIEAGTFGLCEECEEEITSKRLEARPETTLCIKCKEEQERAEKAFG